MIKRISVLALLLLAYQSHAQVAINTNGAPPDASAMLDVASTNSGVLIPRMSAAQRDAISEPASGLMVYVTDDNLFYYYNSTNWDAVGASAGAGSTNIIQTLSQDGTTVTLSDGGGSISVADNDNDSTNELQTLSQSGTTVTLSDGGGSVSIADNDNDSSNEIQTLSKSGTTVTLSNGGGSVSVADNDNDAGNELQTLSKSGFTVTLSNGGGSISLAEELDSKWNLIGNDISPIYSGNVGIGTTTPGEKLTVVGPVRSAYTSTEANYVEFAHGGANAYLNWVGAGNLDFRAGGSTLMTLEPGGDLGIGTTNPTQPLDVNGLVRIRGGSPTAGKALMATDSNGNASWGSAIVSTTGGSETADTVAGGSFTTWKDIGNFAGAGYLNDLSNGDKVLVFCSFRFELSGGSGTDTVDFRVKGQTGSSPNYVYDYSMSMGTITYLNRNKWSLFSFHRVITISQGAGSYLFRMQVDTSGTDDDLIVDQLEITAIKL